MSKLVKIVGYNFLKSTYGYWFIDNNNPDSYELYIKRDKSNTFDEDAVEAFVKISDDELTFSLGYVANSEKTLVNNYNEESLFSATDVVSLLKEKGLDDDKAYKVDLVSQESNNASKSLYMRLPDFELVEKEEEYVKVAGGMSMYPHKATIIERIQKSDTPSIKIEVEGDNYVAYEDLKPIGTVTRDTEKVLKDKDLSKFRFRAIDVNRGTIICTVIAERKTANVSDAYVEKEVERIINNKILTKEEVQERLDLLEEYQVPLIMQYNLFKTIDNKAVKVEKPKKKYIDDDGLVKKAIAYINVGRNLMFRGEKGVGKNVLTETLAYLYNRPLYEFPMNSQHSNNSLFGHQTFDEDKNIVFQKSAIIKAVEEGGVLVLDEFNMGLSHVLTILNGVLADTRRLTVPGYGEIKAHKNFIAIGTMNPNYEGTFVGNQATFDRFVHLEFKSNNSIIEILKSAYPKAHKEDLRICDKIYQGMKNAVKTSMLEKSSLTVRGFIDAILVTSQGLPLFDALIDNLVSPLDDELEKESVLEMIKTQFD